MMGCWPLVAVCGEIPSILEQRRVWPKLRSYMYVEAQGVLSLANVLRKSKQPPHRLQLTYVLLLVGSKGEARRELSSSGQRMIFVTLL